MFFFSNYSTGELYVNNLSDEDSESEIAGNLMGIAASGTFYDGSYFYIDANQNTINKVDFTSDWLINTETILDSIPDAITVNDIAMKPQGDTLFILGELDGGGRGLLSWAVADETFHSLTISLNTGGQIAYGSDGVLYAIAPITDGGSHSLTYIVDTSTGILVLIEDDIIIIEDPFSDISMGPIM